MATEKTLKTRVKMKHGKESEWALATKFTPLVGEIIVYDVDNNHTSPRFKVGDGLTNVNNLKFVNQDELAKITTLGDELFAVKNEYLPKTGGTLSGNLVLSEASATIQKNSSVERGFVINNTNNSAMVNLTMSASKRGIYSSPSSGDGYWVMSSPLNTNSWEFVGTASKSKVLSNLNLASSSSTSTGYWNPYTWTITSPWDGYSGIFAITTNESNAFSGIFSVKVRASQIGVLDVSELKWLSASSTPPELSLSIVETSGTSLVARLYIKVPRTYLSYILSKIQSQYIGTETTSVAIVSSIIGTVKHTAKTVFLPSLSLGSALPIANGGTGSTTASGALSNLGGLAKAGGTMSGGLSIKNGTRFSQIAFAPSFDPSYGGTIVYDAGGTNIYGDSTNFFIRQYSITNGATSSEGMGKFEQFNFPSTTPGLTESASYMILTTKNPPTASQVGALPLSGGKMTGLIEMSTDSLKGLGFIVERTDTDKRLFFGIGSDGINKGIYNSKLGIWDLNITDDNIKFANGKFFMGRTGTFVSFGNISSKGQLVSQTNSYPGLTIQNANGAQLGSFYSTSSDGSYGNVAIAVNKDSSSAAYYTFSNFGRFSSPRDIQTITFRAKSDSNPGFVFLNNNETMLSQFYVATTDGSYGNILLKVLSSATKASYFTFKNDGIFSAPSDIISNGGILKSSRNTNPCFAMTNQNGAWLASLVAVTSDGSYGNTQLAVYKSATESSTFTFSNQGSFRAPNTVYSSLFAVQSNNNPQLMLQNASGAPLGMLYMNTTTGGYSSAYLRVYSSASAYSTFNFGNDGKLSCGSLALATALPISSGGTGTTTAAAARTNLGITPANIGAAASSHTHSYLPLSGGTISGSIAVTGNVTSNGKSVYTAGGNVIYSSTQPTGSTGMIWLKPV